jgi:hypothetical protein
MTENPQLREHLLDVKVPVFAVLDGAQFDDLPSNLFDGDFVHQPLYRDNNIGNRDRIRTAPQLVWLDQDKSRIKPPEGIADHGTDPAILDRLLTLIAERPAAVFWACPQGGDILYKHLRTINMVLFPKDANFDPGKSYEINPMVQAEDDVQAEENRTHDLVLFRHADANVMAQVLPALDEIQFARLFGPASQILFVPDDDWGGRTTLAVKPGGLPKPPTGPLKLHRETIEEIEEARVKTARIRRVQYLRDTCGSEMPGTSDEAITEHIRVSEETGKQLGITSEAAHCRWAYLMFATQGKVSRSPELAEYIRHGGNSPDEQIRLVMNRTISALKQQRSQLDTL